MQPSNFAIIPGQAAKLSVYFVSVDLLGLVD